MRSYLIERQKPAIYTLLRELIPFLFFYLFQQALFIINPAYYFSLVAVFFKTIFLFLTALLIIEGICFILPMKINDLLSISGLIGLFFVFFYLNSQLQYQWFSFNECLGFIALISSFALPYLFTYIFSYFKKTFRI